MKDEIQMKNRYAKKNGTAGEAWCDRYGPLYGMLASAFPVTQRKAYTHEYTRNRIAGKITMMALATFTGRSRVFCNLPPQQNDVFPEKYW